MQILSRTLLIGLLFALALVVQAGDTVLSNTSGTGTSTWFISSEPSLILTGWNLDNANIARPTQLDRASIEVVTPVPTQTVQVVVYQDANGGSPDDATLLRQEPATITQSGRYTHTFTPSVTVTEPVVWVGFYLPVNFEFQGDTSGTSILTYWAWQPGTTFDLSSLGTAAVLGPADGTAPANIDMGGNARIMAEFVTGNSPSETPTQERITQTFGGTSTDFSPMAAYDGCRPLTYDQADISVTYRNHIKVFCKSYSKVWSPPAPEGYTQRGGMIYDVYLFGRQDGAGRLPYAITHCLVPPSGTVSTAVLGLAHGTPETWEILPTVRYDEVVCAEFYYTGVVAAFTPN